MADTRVNYYGSSLDSNKDDEEEDLIIHNNCRGEIFRIAIASGTEFIFY